MNIKPLAVLAAIAALGVPATAAADKPADAGTKGSAKQELKVKGHADKGKTEKTKKAKKAKNAVFKGTVVSADATTVTVHVDKTSRWGRAFKGQDVTFTVAGLKKPVTAVAGDLVLVQARVAKDAVAPLAAHKLKKLTPKAGEDDEGEDEAPKAPESD
jgi:hypothetical protein